MNITIPDELLNNPSSLAQHIAAQIDRPIVNLDAGAADLADRVIKIVSDNHQFTLTRSHVVNAVMAMQSPDDINRAFGIILWEPGQLELAPSEDPADAAIRAGIEDPDVKV